MYGNGLKLYKLLFKKNLIFFHFDDFSVINLHQPVFLKLEWICLCCIWGDLRAVSQPRALLGKNLLIGKLLKCEALGLA